MTVDPRLGRLRDIAGMVADRALAPVAAARAETARIEARIEELGRHRALLLRATEDLALAGPMLAQAERLRQMEAAALSDLARARVALEAVRHAATRAVGREQALGRIAERAALKARRDAARRNSS